MLSKELVMKSAFRLKIMTTLCSLVESCQHQTPNLKTIALRKRRFLIKDKEIDRKNIRFRNLKLETKHDDKWVDYSENTDTATESESE